MSEKGRYTVIREWKVPRAYRSPRVCRHLRDWGEHQRAAADKYWKRPKGRR